MTDPAETREQLGLFFRAALKEAAHRSGAELAFRDRGGRMAVTWAIPGGQSGVVGLDVKRRTHPSYVPATRDWYVHQRYEGLTATDPMAGYTLEAVLAGKLVCLAEPSRLAPRDFFDVNELLRSGEVDNATAIEAFLELRYPDPQQPPGPDKLYEVLLGPGYRHHDDLITEWSVSHTKGLVKSDTPAFAELFDSVDGLLQDAIEALPLPPEPDPPGPAARQEVGDIDLF